MIRGWASGKVREENELLDEERVVVASWDMSSFVRGVTERVGSIEWVIGHPVWTARGACRDASGNVEARYCLVDVYG